MPEPRRHPPERALAWLYTGPLGHFWSVAADIAVYSFRRYVSIEALRKSPWVWVRSRFTRSR